MFFLKKTSFLQSSIFYISLKGEAASLSDRYGLTIGLPAATAVLLKKQLLYRFSHGIGRNFQTITCYFSFDTFKYATYFLCKFYLLFDIDRTGIITVRNNGFC